MARRFWTPEEDALLAALYPCTPTQEIAERLSRSIRAVYARADSASLKKAPEYFEEGHGGRLKRGRAPNATSFRPGHATWNKGKRWVSGGRSAETRFKAGHRPTQWVPVGTEVVDRDGYRKRKVRDDAPPGMSRRNWKFVHVLTWEEANGPVPPGHAVVFANGDRSDIRLDNLALVSRRELMGRNTVHNLPKELAQVVQLKGAVMRQINRREGKHEKRNRRSAQSPVRDA